MAHLRLSWTDRNDPESALPTELGVRGTAEIVVEAGYGVRRFVVHQ